MNLSDLPLLAKKDLNKLYMSVAFPHPYKWTKLRSSRDDIFAVRHCINMNSNTFFQFTGETWIPFR